MRTKTSIRCLLLFGMFASMLLALGACHTRPGEFVDRAVHK